LETLTIVINAAPYGDERLYNALRVARALVSAVVAAKKGQKTPEGYPNFEEILWELIKKGAEVVACSTCASARGLANEDMIEGVQNGTVMQLAHWLKESQGALSF